MKVHYFAAMATASMLAVGLVACGPSTTANPCASTNKQEESNPCAGANPCAAESDPCAGANPCAAKEDPCAGQ